MEKADSAILRAGIQAWGEHCSRQACADCELGNRAAAVNMTCTEFAMKNPDKATSLIGTKLYEKDYTYFDEFFVRFPLNMVPEDFLCQALCRKFVFGGYMDCPHLSSDNKESVCKECWLTPYTTDSDGIEETVHNQIDEDAIVEDLFT